MTVVPESNAFGVEEFAKRIGVKPDWVYRHSKSIPRLTHTRLLLFDDECVRLFKEQHRVDPNRVSRTERSRKAPRK